MLLGQSKKQLNSELSFFWFLLILILLTLPGYIVASFYFGTQIRIVIDSEKLIVIRSVFYALTIIAFPFTNLLRFVMLRLNQTMPGPAAPKQRYFITFMVSMVAAGTIGLLGFIMFILGDTFNTLYIFCLLSVLAIYVFRPKAEEYLAIVEARAGQN